MDASRQVAPERPEFATLAADLRAVMKRQKEAAAVAKAEAARLTGAAVMAKAMDLFGQGKISGADLVRLHALRLRLEEALPVGANSTTPANAG